MFGRPPDPEQHLALDCLSSYGKGGLWSAQTVAMVEARQNGKTASVLLPSAMADIWLRGRMIALWTAHLQSTANKTFADLEQLIAGCSSLSRRVKSITSAAGGIHTVELVNGAQLVFMARTAKAGRGFDEVDSVTCDEALYLTAGQVSALMPTMSVAENPQMRMAGSAGFANSAVWQDIRERGRRGSKDPDRGDPTLAYIEWGAERLPCARKDCRHHKGAAGCRLDDRRLWQQANHTMRSEIVPDGRISEAFIAGERNEFANPLDFAREVMTWWDEPAGENPVSTDVWATLADPASTIAVRSPRVFTIDVSPGLRSAAICVTGRRADGRPHVEVVRYENGTSWVGAEAARLRKAHRGRVVVIRHSPAHALVGDLVAAKVDPYLMSDDEYAAACGVFTAVTERPGPTSLVHLDDPLLNVALAGAAKKDTGDGMWKWSRAASVDICTLVAATMGVWALANLPAPGNVFASRA
jgi:hypothetical protein